MLRIHPAAAVLLCALIAAGPATQPIASPSLRDAGGMPKPRAQSADGTTFPEITAEYWWDNTAIPQLSRIIGSVPTDSTLGPIYALSADHPTAERTRKYLGNNGIDALGYDWVMRNVAGSSFAILKIQGGRIIGVGLLANNTSESWQKKARAIASGGVQQGDGFRIGKLEFNIRTAGVWTKRYAAVTNARGTVVTPARTESNPSAMFVECDDASWLMATSCQSKENFESCISEKVLPGMTMREAWLAMRNYTLKRLRRTDGEEDWAWTKEKVETRQRSVMTDSYGTTVNAWQDVTQEVCARAKISRGLVTSFEWVVGE